MATALEIITGAARLLGVVRKGEALDGDEAEDALDVLNEMLLSWANETSLIPARVRESYTLTSAYSYTIGNGYDLNTAIPPLQIISAFIRTGGIDYPLAIITQQEYDAIAIKSTSGTPEFIAYSRGEGLDFDNSDADDYGTIKLHPAPNSGDALHLLSEKDQLRFSSVTAPRVHPPGWVKAMRYNLALELAPEYSVEPSPSVVKGARESLGAIKLASARNRKMRCEQAVYVSYINSGYD